MLALHALNHLPPTWITRRPLITLEMKDLRSQCNFETTIDIWCQSTAPCHLGQPPQPSTLSRPLGDIRSASAQHWGLHSCFVGSPNGIQCSSITLEPSLPLCSTQWFSRQTMGPALCWGLVSTLIGLTHNKRHPAITLRSPPPLCHCPVAPDDIQLAPAFRWGIVSNSVHM